MNPDDYIEGTFDSNNPINQPELEVEYSELEEQQNWNMELCEKIALAKNQLKYCIELAEQGTNTLLLNNLLKIKL